MMALETDLQIALEGGLRGVLFPLNKHVGTFGQEQQFNQEREQEVKEILELCSKR